MKTGYTRNAGGCLVSAANQNGVKLISVILKSNAIYDDSKELFEYGFTAYRVKKDINLANNKTTTLPKKAGTIN